MIVNTLGDMEALFESTPRPFVFKMDAGLRFKQVVPPA